jgi:hypothetical protein
VTGGVLITDEVLGTTTGGNETEGGGEEEEEEEKEEEEEDFVTNRAGSGFQINLGVHESSDGGGGDNNLFNPSGE